MKKFIQKAPKDVAFAVTMGSNEIV